MKKLFKRALAVSAAAALMAAAMPPVSAKDYKKETVYPTPFTAARDSAEYKRFVKASPKLSIGTTPDYYYYSNDCVTLSWTEVDNALLYYVYGKKGKTWKKIGPALGSSASIYGGDYASSYVTGLTDKELSEYTAFKIRAVTYDTNDSRIMSAYSNTVSYTKREKPPVVVYDEEIEEEAEYDDEAVEYEAYEEAYEDVVDGDSYSLKASYAPAPATLNGAFVPYENSEEYTSYDKNGFKKASDSPLSTISADVDTAAYANARRMVNNGSLPAADSVRTEEFINYFDYDYAKPKGNSVFSVTYELSDCPWNSKAQLLMLGIHAKDVEKEPDSNLVFLIDVSGSMDEKEKLPLVGDSLKKLSSEMSAEDTLSIVTYSGEERVCLTGAKGNMKKCVGDIMDALEANGSTNGEAGINMAYDIAEKYYKQDGSNRVILATDGDLNVGISDKDELSKFIAGKRQSGVYLTVLGVGSGNLKDNKMEALAKDGNGNYHYIDCAEEASKVLVDERKQTLVTVADDVKFQLEFNPALVDSYRLVGYEGRRLENEDFADDKKDAADVGAGQSVTVMYEVIRTDSAANTLKYQKSTGNTTDLCTLKMRYKKPGSAKSVQTRSVIKAGSYLKYEDTGIRFRFAACVAEAAMYLSGDTSYGNVSIQKAYSRYRQLDRAELAKIGYSDDFGDFMANAVKLAK